MVDNVRVSGRPSKDFFIDMITRDIGLPECILDLVDNAVDQAVEDSGIDVVSALTDGANRGARFRSVIRLTLGADRFVIADDCAGIPIAEARDRVFKFGNPEEPGAVGGLSVYGIGMKRAFFKLGRSIAVRSRTRSEHFRIDIDVDQWRKQGDDDWDFEFAEKGANRKRSHSTGTRIEVTKLNQGVAARLQEASFREEMIRRLAITYSFFLTRGLTIWLGAKRIGAALPTLGRYRYLRPARKRIREGGVDVVIIAGVTPREDRVPRGWYVFCNGRMVLEADKSRTTGWGDDLPQWHTKYGHFVGYVYFHSADVRKLPWTTTKQGVVTDSAVFRAALAEMKVQARPVLGFLTKLYPTDEPEADDLAGRSVLENAQSVAINKVSRRDSLFMVDLKKAAPKGGARVINILYKKPAAEVERAKKLLGRQISASKLGEHTFDYFVAHESDK